MIHTQAFTDSSVASKLTYNDEDNTLRITFVTGKTYEYSNVPKEVYDEAIAASSIGSFIHNHIKGKYNFKHHGYRK